MNTLQGIAAAMYKSNGEDVLSISVIASTSRDAMWVDRTEKIPVHSQSCRNAIQKVLDLIDIKRTQAVPIRKNHQKDVALPVVFGFARDKENSREEYAPMLRDAFPETLSTFDASTSVHALLEHVLREGISSQGAKPIPQLHNYELTRREIDVANDEEIPAESIAQARGLEHFLQLARSGDRDAWNRIVEYTKLDAQIEVAYLAENNAMNGVRFHRKGSTSEAYKRCARFTYIEEGDLKNIYAREMLTHMKQDHHISIRSPKDQAPPFADIVGTFLADEWRDIHFLRTGKRKQLKNVCVETD